MASTVDATRQHHSVAQIEQAAQHLGLLMGALRQSLGNDALPPAAAALMEELASEYIAFQELIYRHTAILRSLVV